MNILPPTVEKVIEDSTGMKFSYVAGLIPKDETFRFKRLLFRKTHGNVVTIIHDMENALESFDKKKIEKSLYVVIFRDSEVIKGTVYKVCEAFSSDMYFCLIRS